MVVEVKDTHAHQVDLVTVRDKQAFADIFGVCAMDVISIYPTNGIICILFLLSTR